MLRFWRGDDIDQTGDARAPATDRADRRPCQHVVGRSRLPRRTGPTGRWRRGGSHAWSCWPTSLPGAGVDTEIAAQLPAAKSTFDEEIPAWPDAALSRPGTRLTDATYVVDKLAEPWSERASAVSPKTAADLERTTGFEPALARQEYGTPEFHQEHGTSPSPVVGPPSGSTSRGVAAGAPAAVRPAVRRWRSGSCRSRGPGGAGALRRVLRRVRR
jgi:hypothetical protein